jgi:hypothetical protein
MMRLDARPRFAPHFSPAQGPQTIMDIEYDELGQTDEGGRRSPQGLLECLEYWSRRNGYKKLDAQSIRFKSVERKRPATPSCEQTTDMPMSTDLEIDTNGGGEITLYKTKM